MYELLEVTVRIITSSYFGLRNSSVRKETAIIQLNLKISIYVYVTVRVVYTAYQLTSVWGLNHHGCEIFQIHPDQPQDSSSFLYSGVLGLSYGGKTAGVWHYTPIPLEYKG
jgi:hypothetical protein